eukprot:jgi/Orpsp1_1/1190340/evm.model.d7180000078377.1
MYSSNEYKTEGYIINARQSETGNNEQKINGGGLIASIEGYSSLYVENFYGENLNAENGIGAFTLNYGSSIELKNIKLNNISGSNIGGVLFTSENEEI